MLPVRHPAEDWAALDSARYYASARLASIGWKAGGTLQRIGFAVTHPHLIPGYLRLLRRLPVATLTVSPLPAGKILHDRWNSQSWRKAASHACLSLPSTPESYLRGRRKQAVRTNLHRAAAIDLCCRRVAVDWATTRVSLAEGPFAGLVNQLDSLDSVEGLVQCWEVRDPAGIPLGRAVSLVDGRTALLLWLAGPADLTVAHQTRYLLHTAMVNDLIGKGVQQLVVESILGAPLGHKYFAARLGYRACRIRVATEFGGRSVRSTA
jgi:hypothetical protein